MSDYSETFSKLTGQVIEVADFETEFDAIATAVASKCDITSGTLTSPTINTGVSGTAVLDEDDMASDSATQIATQQSIKAYIDSYTGGLKRKVLEIGVWNMDITTSVTVAHGLTKTNIRGIKCLIISDSGAYVDYGVSEDYSATSLDKQLFADATNINIERATGSDFDSAAYNDGVINRGYVIIDYV